MTRGTTVEIATPHGEPSKLLGLELVRFACAMTVLIFHFKHFALIPGLAVNRGIDMPWAVPLSLFYTYGSYGVQIFWCISGFIFYWKYADALAARKVEAKRFFWLRFSRLYPLHLVTLLFVAGVQPLYTALAGQPFNYAGNDAARFVAQLFLADQWGASRALSFNAPIWSVSAEVLVYVAFFLLVRAFGKSPLVIVAAIGASLSCLWSDTIWPAVICGGYFFAGGAAALWLGSARRQQRPNESRRIALAMIAACVIGGFFIDLRGSGNALATWLMALTPPILFLAAQDTPALERWARPIQAAGNLTYSTYLIHFPLQLAIATAALAAGLTLPVREAWFLLFYLVATLVIGRIVFVRFESPVQAMIRRATLAPRQQAAAVLS